MSKNVNTIIITPNKATKQVFIEWQFEALFKRLENGGFHCHVPCFNIHYYAADQLSIEKKALAMTQMLFDHLMQHDSKKGIKNLGLYLHKQGFKEQKNDILAMREMVNNRAIKANFGSTTRRPPEFLNHESLRTSSKKEVELVD